MVLSTSASRITNQFTFTKKPISMCTTTGEGAQAADVPMIQPEQLRWAKRYGAEARSDKPCQAPAERGKTRCRFHGARAGASKGERNGSYKHGGVTKEARALRAEARRLLAELSEG
jgi:hypothetical protein